MKNKEYIFGSFITVVLVVVILFNLKNIPQLNYENMLANISNIDIDSLKQWQQNSGFRKNLGMESKGSEVKILQKALSTDPNLYPQKIISGVFGSYTKNALIAFQKENGLSVTGSLNKETRDKINGIFYGELCPIQSVEYPDYLDFTFSKTDILPSDFVPKDLQNINNYDIKNVGGIVCLKSIAIDSLKNMFDDAKKEEINLAISSGFRKFEIQGWLVNYYKNTMGEENALKVIAQPGYSEHQLGTAVDLTGKSINYASTSRDFANTKEYIWLQKNASKYGFSLSFPEGNSEFIFEPWHFRFRPINQ